MRTNSLACLCAVAGLGLVGCPGPEVTPPDTNVAFPSDTGPRDAGRDARGDSGPVDAFVARDTGAVDTGVAVDMGVGIDAFAESDAGVDAFVMSTEDAFGLDAFSTIDAFAPDAFVVLPMDAGRDAFVRSDAGRDAFAVDADRDAFIGPDAFHGDAFLPACAPATHLVINEIDYDQTATDTAEFIEIFNPTSAAVSLAGYTVVGINGSTAPGPEYARIALTGTIAAGGYVVVTASGSTVAGSMFTLPLAIQNGDPDGVLLLGPSGIVDAAIYGGTMTTAMLTSGGATMITESGSIGDDPVVGSLSRRPNGCDRDMPTMDWYITPVATPGAANP